MLVILAIIVGVVALDQLTKWLTVVFLEVGETVPIWQDVLHLTHHHNKGAAFGILSEQRWVFMILSTVAIVGILIYLFRFPPKNKFLTVMLAMIVGGGIGNMIDRVFLGYVIDFIDVRLINFAIFNVADSFVSVGAMALIGYLLLEILREWKAEKAAAVTKSTDDENTGDNDADPSN